jgi:hypothetical protein
MAFAARQDDEGKWRLCRRKGNTIFTVFGEEVIFSSQAKAKKCCDDLNDRYWKVYEREHRNGGENHSPDVVWGIIDTIANHGGLNASQMESLGAS